MSNKIRAIFALIFSAQPLLLTPVVQITGGQMLSNSLKRTLLVVLAVASVSHADQFGIQPGDGFDGDQHSMCDNPYDPNCQPGGFPGQPHEPGYPNLPGYDDSQSDTRSIYLGRSVNNEVLDLRRLAGLGVQYRGWEVVSVRGKTRPNSPYTTTVQLLADGRNVATQVNPGKRINLQPTQRIVLGSTRELEMYINGSTFVDEIVIEIRDTQGGSHPQPPQYPGYPGQPHEPPPYPGNPYPGNPGYGQQNLDLWINRSTYGNDRIDLGMYFNMHQYRGYRIEQVIVHAQAQHNVALADLLINGFNQGTLQFDRYSRAESLYLHQRPEIGVQASSLVLYTRGNMNVQRVTLVLSRY